jgi:hypothetical protein
MSFMLSTYLGCRVHTHELGRFLYEVADVRNSRNYLIL